MKKMIKKGNHNNPLIAALLRAGIGTPDKCGKVDFPVEFNKDRMAWIYADDSVFYRGTVADSIVCRGLWVDPAADRERFANYIATAPERTDYPNGRWVYGTNSHNTVSLEEFDKAVKPVQEGSAS